jgi:hypothetical protein
VENPLRSEASAFRLVLFTLGAFAVVAVAGLVWGGWAAFAAWLAVTAGVVAHYATRPGTSERRPRRSGAEVRVVVVVDETTDGDRIAGHVAASLSGRPARVVVIAPAVTWQGRPWPDDADAERAEAQERLEAALARLASAGIAAEGRVGSADPLETVADAVAEIAAGRVLVVVHPRADASWAEGGLVERLRERLDVPVEQIALG